MMHQNYSREDSENRFNQNPVVQKRSAFSNITNVTNGKQMMEKGGVKKMDVKKTNPVLTRNNTFGVQPQPLQTRTNMPLQQTRQPLQVNNTKLTSTVLPKTNFTLEQPKVQPKKEEEVVDEIEDEEEEDLLDMSISMDDMSNMSLENIDEYDHEDPTCCSELVNEIYGFLRQKETSEAIQANYFDTTQKDINQKMRSILIDWLVDVHSKFKLLNDTLFMAVSLIDRFLEKESVSRKKLQLVGVTAMFIASKFEEIYAPEVGDFVYICDKAYTKEEILQYEIHILNTLSFEISHPTPIHFLRRFSKAAKSDNKTHTLSKYLIELSLMEFELQKKPFTPSMIAAASIYITRKMINPKLYWNSTLRHYTQYKESEIMPCVQVLNELLKKTQKGGSSLNAIYRKYSTRYFGVANIPHVEI